MAKRKRLKLTPEDRVTGVQPREKRDLFAGCNEAGKEWFQRDAYVFMHKHCRICKNADCIRAKGAVSPWQTRMAEQVDYLINNPNFSDMSSDEHQSLARMGFDSIRQKMERLEIARRRQDWEVPEAPEVATDGFDKVASPDTTDQFDDAVKALAKAKGNKEPELERPQSTEQPAHFQEVSQSEFEYETNFPSSDGKSTYHVTFSREGAWACVCAGFKHRQKCRHLDTVRAWYEDQVEQAEEQERQEQERQTAPPRPSPPQQPPPDPPPDPRVPRQRLLNTPMPQNGVMVGGGEAPSQPMRPRPREREAADPWAVSNDKVVEPGATVTVKGGKKR